LASFVLLAMTSQLLPSPLADQPFSRFILSSQKIGSGGQSRSGVWICRRRVKKTAQARGEKLAGKTLVWKQLNGFEIVKREVEILKKVSHPNIVRLVDYEILQDWRSGKALIVTELMKYGDLMTFHTQTIRRNLVEKEVAPINHQILLGLRCIHGKGIVHRDLKCCNILVAGFQIIEGIYLLIIKIADFGFSKKMSDEANSTEPHLPAVRAGSASSRASIHGWFVGTNEYAAPEVFAVDDDRDRALAATVYRSTALDLWSLGVILFRLFTGMAPGNTKRAFKDSRTGKEELRVCPALSGQVCLDEDVEDMKGCQGGFKNLIARHLKRKLKIELLWTRHWMG